MKIIRLLLCIFPQLIEASPANGLFVRAIVSKRQVVTQEALVLTFKSYSHSDVSWLEFKMADMQDFYMEELTLPPQSVTKTETLNGEDYKTIIWGEYLLFPLSPGRLKIPGQTFRGMMVVKDVSTDPFEAYLNGGATQYMEVAVTVQSPAVEIDVMPLPPPPDDFSGGVGRFILTARLDSTYIKTGQLATLRVFVDGCGNLNMMQKPVVHFPNVFSEYDIKQQDSIHITRRGAEGRLTYDYGISPRYAGNFDIAGPKLVYYDVDSSKYCTLSTDSFHVSVTKGEGTSSYDDIRNIKTATSGRELRVSSFFGSTRHWMLLGFFILLALAVFTLLRHHSTRTADKAQLRERRAGKESARRLRRAEKLMVEGREREFYEEVLHALWGFASDKLRISQCELSRERIATALKARNIDESVISMFINIVDKCEFSHYAPKAATTDMQLCFTETKKAIEALV